MATTIVYCTANRGKSYRVVFHDENPFAVFSLYRRNGKEIHRAIWHADEGMGLTVFCAINAARRKCAETSAAIKNVDAT